MAERMERAAAVGEQLTFLADPDGAGGKVVPVEPVERKAGRPKGSKNRVESKLREMLAAKGMRMPEDVLAEIAGLSSREDVLMTAMARAERVLDWAESGAEQVKEEGVKRAWKPTGAQRLSVFFDIYRAQIKALEALLPYGLAKVTPDATVNQTAVQIVMPGGAGSPAPTVIEGGAGRKMAPPPMPEEIEQNQQVSNSSTKYSDGKARTE